MDDGASIVKLYRFRNRRASFQNPVLTSLLEFRLPCSRSGSPAPEVALFPALAFNSSGLYTLYSIQLQPTPRLPYALKVRNQRSVR